MAKKKSSPYRLQRWWIAKGWSTLETSISKSKILRSYRGWCRQIIGGSFRIRKGKRTIIGRYGSLYKKIKRKRRK